MDSSEVAAYRRGQAANLRLAVVGRYLFLGLCTGMGAGAVAAALLDQGDPEWFGVVVTIYAVVAGVVGLVVGGILAGVALRLTAPLTARARMWLTMVPVWVALVAVWFLAQDSAAGRGPVAVLTVATITGGASFFLTPWCVAPLRELREHGGRQPR